MSTQNDFYKHYFSTPSFLFLQQNEMVRGVRGWRDSAAAGRRVSSSSRFVLWYSQVGNSVAESTGRRDAEQRRPHAQLGRPNAHADVEFQSQRDLFVCARAAATAVATPRQSSSSFQSGGGRWNASTALQSLGILARRLEYRSGLAARLRRQHAATRRRRGQR